MAPDTDFITVAFVSRHGSTHEREAPPVFGVGGIGATGLLLEFPPLQLQHPADDEMTRKRGPHQAIMGALVASNRLMYEAMQLSRAAPPAVE